VGEGERESSGCVLGVAAGFALFAALVGFLATRPAASVDGAQRLGEWFELGPLPFGLEVAEGVRAGATTVVLANPSAPEEAPRNEPPEEEEEPGGGDGPRAKDDDDFDWSKVPEGPAGTDPIEVAVACYRNAGQARSAIEGTFGRPDGGDRDDPDLISFGAKGGRATMDRGRIPWGEYSVLFVHERELEPGGTFRDVMRANLTISGRACVVSARWPRGLPASKDKLEELIAVFRPRAAE